MQIYFNGREHSPPQVQVDMGEGFVTSDSPIAIRNGENSVIEPEEAYDVRIVLFHPDMSDMSFTTHLKTLKDGRLLFNVPVNLRFQEQDGPEWKVARVHNNFALWCGYLEHRLYVVDYPNGVKVMMGGVLIDFLAREPLPSILWEARRVLRDKLLHWGKVAASDRVTPKPRKPNRFSLVE